MLSSFKLGILTLINNALKGEQNLLPEDFDYSKFYDFAVRQQIIPLVYYGGYKLPGFTEKDIEGKIRSGAIYAAMVSEKQILEINKICQAFDVKGIDYLKLKGTNLKALYPRTDMRIMGDADILIRTSQMKDIEPVMISLGYTQKICGEYEWVWNNGVLKIELHKSIISTHVQDFYAYFGDGWKFARKKEGNTREHIMSLEDEFIFLFTHFARHYRYAGIGIKHATDIHVFLKAHDGLDLEYVYSGLEKLGLLKFYQNVRRMLDVWFDGAEGDEVSAFLTEKIFENGAYGTKNAGLRSEAVIFSKGTDAKGAKRKKFWRLVFPEYKDICPAYPWLNGRPLLLPFAWIYRIIITLLFRRDKITSHKKNIEAINKAEIDAYQAELNFVGLDFNYEV